MIEEQIDINNFIDYNVAQIYYANTAATVGDRPVSQAPDTLERLRTQY